MVHKAATAAAIQKAVQTIYVMTKGAKIFVYEAIDINK